MSCLLCTQRRSTTIPAKVITCDSLYRACVQKCALTEITCNMMHYITTHVSHYKVTPFVRCWPTGLTNTVKEYIN